MIMKRLTVFAAILMVACAFVSCKGTDDDHNENGDGHSFRDFIGVWGVKQIDYYNIDYAGNPIEASRETYCFTPGDMEGGIDLVFREDKTGEMRDRSLDTIIVKHETTPVTYDTIICPDTTLYTYFDYSYDAEEAVMYMNMETVHTYKMRIVNLDKDSYTYLNEYRENYIEEAQLVRISNSAKALCGQKPTKRSRKIGSFLSNR